AAGGHFGRRRTAGRGRTDRRLPVGEFCVARRQLPALRGINRLALVQREDPEKLTYTRASPNRRSAVPPHAGAKRRAPSEKNERRARRTESVCVGHSRAG